MRRLLTATLLAGAALATTGAAPAEEQAMLDAFDRVLTAMAYAASGLCLFAIVWAGFVLMAEGAEERGGGRAKSAVVDGRRRPGAGPSGQGGRRAAAQRPRGLPDPLAQRRRPS